MNFLWRRRLRWQFPRLEVCDGHSVVIEQPDNALDKTVIDPLVVRIEWTAAFLIKCLESALRQVAKAVMGPRQTNELFIVRVESVFPCRRKSSGVEHRFEFSQASPGLVLQPSTAHLEFLDVGIVILSIIDEVDEGLSKENETVGEGFQFNLRPMPR